MTTTRRNNSGRPRGWPEVRRCPGSHGQSPRYRWPAAAVTASPTRTRRHRPRRRVRRAARPDTTLCLGWTVAAESPVRAASRTRRRPRYRTRKRQPRRWRRKTRPRVAASWMRRLVKAATSTRVTAATRYPSTIRPSRWLPSRRRSRPRRQRTCAANTSEDWASTVQRPREVEAAGAVQARIASSNSRNSISTAARNSQLLARVCTSISTTRVKLNNDTFFYYICFHFFSLLLDVFCFFFKHIVTLDHTFI